jgi:hypothetical protein
MTYHAEMGEELTIIKMNAALYQAVLNRNLDDKQRSIVRQLLAEAERSLLTAATTEQNALAGDGTG